MSPLRTLIVGCGRIAGGFDADGAGDLPLTHAGAYVRHGGFELTACVEPEAARREAFMRRWNVQHGYASIDEAIAAARRFDVVSVCSPTERHADHLERAVRLEPRAIFCEKPLAQSAQSAERAVEQCRRAKVMLAVNYTRRWDPEIAQLNDAIRRQRWGVLRSVVGYYNKGLLNNGSHLLDLLLLLLGPMQVVEVGKAIPDYVPEDPSVPAWLQSSDGVPVHVVCGHASDYALFELQLIFARALVTMEEGGMFWRERSVEESEIFAGYRIPGEGVRRSGGYRQAMLRSVGNIYSAIENGDPLASTGESALAAQRLCERIIQ